MINEIHKEMQRSAKVVREYKQSIQERKKWRNEIKTERMEEQEVIEERKNMTAIRVIRDLAAEKNNSAMFYILLQ